MADGTKAVVDASVADEAALAMELDGIGAGERPGDAEGTAPAAPADEEPGTAPDSGSEGAVRADGTGDGESADSDGTADGPDRTAEDGTNHPTGRTGATGAAAAKAATDDAETALRDAVTAREPAQDGPESPEAAGDSTAQLSAREIAAELAADPGARAARPAAGSRSGSSARRPADTPSAPAPASRPTARPVVSTETLDADTGTLPASRPAPLRRSGDKIGGRYRLEECITQSETFSSWRAVDEKLRRAVGVHLMAAGHRRAKSVLTASRSAALLNDPRFVQVLDAVQEGDLVYVVREWLPNASDLAQLLADGPMEPYDAYQMLRQVTDAVAAAHRRGQAHLRLTPRCVLRTDTGQYRINGIAVDAALRGLSTENAELTDTRAIGALLFAALTHRWPYPEDRYDLRGMPRSLGSVPPDQVRAGVHKGLSEIAARALCEHPPHHLEPITSPDGLAKAIALMPKIRQPDQPAPVFSAAKPKPRPAPRPAPRAYPEAVGPAGRPPQDRFPEGSSATTGARTSRRRRVLRGVLKTTASLVALAAIVVGSWQAVEHLNKGEQAAAEQSDGHASHGPSQPALPLTNQTLAYTASSFNAFGDKKAEHASELPALSDGKNDTTWSTQSYNDPFGSGYKPGTGLLLDLGTARTVGSVDIRFSGSHKVELKAAPADTTTAPAATQAGFEGFGASIANGSGTGVQLKPAKPITTRYLLIWLTGIPNDGAGGYQGHVAEITVNG
ncbi:serine/threonine protein kinase [Kitasatospora sp. NPDC059571]|uniref:serine/threonine protein kinase n=1 Tax=Kitasatospora sp. NPDC059571 TaxID=3346871 RepID=UPI00367F023D